MRARLCGLLNFANESPQSTFESSHLQNTSSVFQFNVCHKPPLKSPRSVFVFNVVPCSLDIHAKEGTQETAVTLVGLVAGMQCANYLNDSSSATWITFVLLTALHVYANWKAMSVLVRALPL